MREKKSPSIVLKMVRSERGDALVVAMIMAAVCAITGLSILQYTSQLETESRRPRVKSMIAATEAKVRELLISPLSYTGCTETGPRSTCRLADSVVSSLSKPVPGAKCPSSKPNCGILVTKTAFTHTDTVPIGNSKATVTIQYEGSELSFKEIKVVMDIPIDILRSSGLYKCPTNFPKFMGFDNAGAMICTGFAAPAGPGSYVNVIDMRDLRTTVQTLDATKACGRNQLIGSIQWTNGGTTLNVSCINRPDPFTEFGFVPGSRTGDPTYVNY